MARIEVSTEALRQLENEIRANGERMNNCAEHIQRYLQELGEVWDSPAGEVIRYSIAKEMHALKKSGRSIYDYMNFLGVTADLYDSMERKLEAQTSFI